jgi:hypothetical protein
MNTALALMLPGLLGGLILAAVLARLNRRPSSTLSRRPVLEPISPDVINMAHIRVAGVGGLGMMAAALIIAINLPEIGFALLVAVALGVITAGGLIAYRSRTNQAGGGGHNETPPSVLTLDTRQDLARAPERKCLAVGWRQSPSRAS